MRILLGVHESQPPPLALALAWVSRIMATAVAMAVPAIAGQWLDARLGTGWIGLGGLAVGFAGGLAMLVHLAKTLPRREKP